MKLIELREDVILYEKDLLLELSNADMDTLISSVYNILVPFRPKLKVEYSAHFAVDRVTNKEDPTGGYTLSIDDLTNMFVKLVKTTKDRIFLIQKKVNQNWILKDPTIQANFVIAVKPTFFNPQIVGNPANVTLRLVTVHQKPCNQFGSDRKYPNSIALDVNTGKVVKDR